MLHPNLNVVYRIHNAIARLFLYFFHIKSLRNSIRADFNSEVIVLIFVTYY